MREGGLRLTGGRALVRQLVAEGVSDVFAVPGVQLDWAVDAMREARKQVRLIVPRHEQATSYTADGYARTTGREGVCMVVPGPGVLNALAGLATAYAVNSRVVFIAGQIPSGAIGRGLGLLHEIPDQSGILSSLTKWSGIARSAAEVPALVHEAFVQLRSGRSRPVAIEIPPDVLQDVAPMVFHPRAIGHASPVGLVPLQQAADMLAAARNPVIVAGGGVAAAGGAAALRRLAELLQAPAIMAAGSRGVLSDRHPLALSSLSGRIALAGADVVLAAGSRFLDARGAPTHASADCRFIYLNIDASAADPPRSPGLVLQGDTALGLAALGDLLAADPRLGAPREAGMILAAAARRWATARTAELKPQGAYLDVLRDVLPDDGILVSELTQVGYASEVAYPVYEVGTYLTPGYQRTFGYELPTAIGAALGNPSRRVVSINGDGGFGWNLQELATAARYRVPLTVSVFVDGKFGNVHRIQAAEFGQTYATELHNPDLMLLAQAFGVVGRRVEQPAQLADALRETLATNDCTLIEVRVEEMPNPWPLIHAFLPNAPPLPPELTAG